MKEKFSPSLEQLDPEDIEINARRIAVYSPEALKVAADVDRIYVSHPGFTSALKAFDRLFQIAGEFEMPQGMVIECPTGVGKTSVFRYFRDALPSSNLFSPGLGALGIRSTSRPTPGYLIKSLLWAYRYPFSSGGETQLYARRGVLIDLIRQKGTRLLFIDEATGLIEKLSNREPSRGESEVTDLLREIVDECRIALVLSTHHGGSVFDRVDPSLSSRITVRIRLDNFKPDQFWLGLLKSYVKQSSRFDLTAIEDPVVAKRLHLASSGNLRQLKRLLTEAVLIAVAQEKAELDPQILVQAFNEINGAASEKTNVFD